MLFFLVHVNNKQTFCIQSVHFISFYLVITTHFWEEEATKHVPLTFCVYFRFCRELYYNCPGQVGKFASVFVNRYHESTFRFVDWENFPSRHCFVWFTSTTSSSRSIGKSWIQKLIDMIFSFVFAVNRSATALAKSVSLPLFLLFDITKAHSVS